MGTFHYVATDRGARVVRGSFEAADEHAVISWLRESGYYPIRVERREGEVQARSRRIWRLSRRPSRQEILIFTQQFHALLEAGLEVDRSLAIVSDLVENSRLRRIVRAVLADVQGGLSLADSLAKHPTVFPKLYVNMVKAGEAGGVLEPVLGRLAAFLESSKVVRDEVMSAMLYPSLVLAVGLGSVFVLLNFVIPRFARLFSEAGQLLPLPTRILMAVSGFTSGYWWIPVGLLVLAPLGVRSYIQTEEGRAMWDRLKLRLPILGQLVREMEASRFARTLGTLLQSGVPILTALGIVGETIGNVVIAQAIPGLRDGVKRGKGIAGPLKESGAFPPLAVHMAKVGEETGRMEDMLLKVADVYDAHVKTSLKRFLALLEPVLILSLGIVVSFMVLSMLLAIFSLSDLPL
jgi:general secretion pathway protein F